MDFQQIFNQTFILKFIKFCMVGFTGVFVDFGITFVCKEYLKIQKYLSNALGFSIAATSNYFLNRVWTFQSHNPHVGMEFTRFFMIALIGLGINLVILWTMTGKFKVNFYVSKLAATLLVTTWNFLINAYFTFA